MKNTHLILILILSPLAGCVSAAKFKAENARAESARARLVDSENALALARKSEADLRAQLQETNDKLAAAQKSNQDLQAALDAKKGELSRQVAELIKERDALSQRLAEAQSAAAQALQEKQALELAKQQELDQVKQNYEALTAGLKTEIAAGEITISQLKGKLTVNMVDRILFDSGKAEVRSAGKAVLDRIGAVLANVADKDIRIEGHTDNVPIGGELKNRYPTNWELSTARATAVSRYLQEKVSLDPKRLVAAGYGEHRPVAANDTPENRALNRRIEIVLIPRE